jgi:succinate dehydrogenase / fumarate reductase cytochrome b subunit|tara:strand:- start:1490 stop:2191 length:702 start_codon:yes stop_codon:yes gene_type:complete
MTMSNNGLLKSSLSKKYVMALTGLFLCLFLVGHLVGNLQLFIPGEEGVVTFNEYAKFMTSNPAIKILSYLTYAGIIFHMLDGFYLTIQNRKARPVKYVVEKGSANSSWSSRNMALLGTILLVFLVTHMSNFWYVMHFELPIPVDGGVKDLHHVVMTFFSPENQYALVCTILYVVAMVSMGLHLWHGFQSAFQSLGVNHPKYTPLVKKFGAAFSILVPAAFAAIPVYLYYTQLA